MAARLEGKIAFITGAARGQGRSHAVRLAEEGADIIAIDICDDIEGVTYPGSTPEDLTTTVKLVESLDRRIVAIQADVRDQAAVTSAVDAGVAEFGRLDIVAANAGISPGPVVLHDTTEADWQAVIDINLTGVWHTAKAAIPHMISGGRGGSIVITSSVGGLRAHPNIGSYIASKHGEVGLMRALALELAPHWIRVNTIHPTQVDTPMIMNDVIYRLFCPDLEHPTRDDFEAVAKASNALPVAWVEPVDISNALLFLSSDEARYITGVALPVDAGSSIH